MKNICRPFILYSDFLPPVKGLYGSALKVPFVTDFKNIAKTVFLNSVFHLCGYFSFWF